MLEAWVLCLFVGFGKPFLLGLSPRKGAKAAIRTRMRMLCMYSRSWIFLTRLGQAVWHLRSFSSARPEAVALGSAARPERSGVSRDSVRTKDGNAHARFQRADEH